MGRIMAGGRPPSFNSFTCPNCQALYHIVKVEAGPGSVFRNLEPAYGAFTRSQALDEQVSLIVINRLRVFGAGVSKTTEFHRRADHSLSTINAFARAHPLKTGELI